MDCLSVAFILLLVLAIFGPAQSGESREVKQFIQMLLDAIGSRKH